MDDADDAAADHEPSPSGAAEAVDADSVYDAKSDVCALTVANRLQKQAHSPFIGVCCCEQSDHVSRFTLNDNT